jgi:hypothetical protein
VVTEQECCPFFTFQLAFVGATVELTADASTQAQPLVAALFGVDPYLLRSLRTRVDRTLSRLVRRRRAVRNRRRVGWLSAWTDRTRDSDGRCSTMALVFVRRFEGIAARSQAVSAPNS